jgi:MSHA biogenesis protein MshJ
MMQRFAQLKQNERRLILISALAGTLLLAYNFFIEPAQQKAASLRQQIDSQQRELSELQNQLPGLRQLVADPDAQLRSDIDKTKQQLAGVDTELQQYSHLLVAPAQMPRLLQNMLSRHRGLQLVSLRTIAATPLLPPRTEAAAVPATPNLTAQPATTGAAAPPPGGIYRHGLEITVAGSYNELLAYAAELQGVSPRPLWSGLALKVVEYPRSELTFTLYTLSLDLPWLAV